MKPTREFLGGCAWWIGAMLLVLGLAVLAPLRPSDGDGLADYSDL